MLSRPLTLCALALTLGCASTNNGVTAPVDSGACAFDQSYRYAFVGGNAPTRSEWTLAPPREYRLSRYSADGSLIETCALALPACASGGAGGSVARIMALLRDPAVVAQFVDGEVVLGTDPRPVDGALRVLTRADGRRITWGGQCPAPTPATCRPVPEALDALATALSNLNPELGVNPSSCAGFPLP